MPRGRYKRSETVTVERPNAQDKLNKYGDRLKPTTFVLKDVVFAPLSSSERHDHQDQVTTRMTMYPPPDAALTAYDVVIRSDGTRWQLEGDPFNHANPYTGRRPGGEVVVQHIRS